MRRRKLRIGDRVALVTRGDFRGVIVDVQEGRRDLGLQCGVVWDLVAGGRVISHTAMKTYHEKEWLDRIENGLDVMLRESFGE